MEEKQILQATGRRKEAVARVRVFCEGKGRIIINGKDFTSYFVTIDQRFQIQKPLLAVDMGGQVDVFANVTGGGNNGQAGAVSLGIARCLLEWNPELRGVLKKDNFLTRDPRAKERKKYGRKGARCKFQWTKR